jgi:hypothetical protein
VFSLLALRNFLHKPWRSALLFLGFGMGVSVMIVLLSIGEAMVTQAQNERLVGGGDVTVLPEGIDIEVMKTGGLGGLYFSIANARFLYLQLLAAPRLAGSVRAVAPQSEGKLLYLTTPDGTEQTVRASGDIPSATAAVGAAPVLAAGEWRDDSADRRWTRPTPAELEADIDHFHVPPAGLANRKSWAEWHYFNVLSSDRRRWAFITFMLAGEVPDGQWGGRVLITTHEAPAGGGPARERRFTATVPPAGITYSTTSPDLSIGTSHVTLLPDGRYAIAATAQEEGGGRRGGRVRADLIVDPVPGAYFPGTAIETGDFASGYTVPGLEANATGTLCVDAACEHFDGAQSYHDHNWGVWKGVTWEWGSARAGSYGLLYGRVQPPDSLGASAPLFVYLVDTLGFRAVFRPSEIVYDDARVIRVGGRELHVPASAVMADNRGSDSLRVELDVEDAVATDTRGQFIERGEGEEARRLVHPYFIQMKGRARLSGRVGGALISGEGTGFFETYR